MQSLPSEYKYDSFKEYIQGLLDSVGVKLRVNAIIPYTFKFTNLTLDETDTLRSYNFTTGASLVINSYTDVFSDPALLTTFWFGNISIKTRCDCTVGNVNATAALVTSYVSPFGNASPGFRFFEEAVAAGNQANDFTALQDCFFNFLRMSYNGAGVDFLMKCHVDFTGFKITTN